jgi:two-component system sensor kinase FixL
MGSATVPDVLKVHHAFPRLLNAGRRPVLVAILVAIVAIAFIDAHWVSISLGGLYIFPMLLAATVLSPPEVLGLALLCTVLRCFFDDSQYAYQYAIRFFTSFATYVLSGLFVIAVIRNRRMTLAHVAEITEEQRLRNEAQERLNILVESSPAAILTLSDRGVVLAANHAANVLFGVIGESLEGRSIQPYLPMLSEALRLGIGGKPFRTGAQAQGRRENGEIFLADLWFSTYPTPQGTQLAAIIVDTSEQLRDREQENLRQLSTSSRLVISAVLHEIRNLCSAISVVYSNLKEKDAPCRLEEIQGLETLVRGLGRVASLELCAQTHDDLEDVFLQQVLDDLRIIVEPGWEEIGGSVVWATPPEMIRVQADRYGLLQVFLNLAQNSHRAVQNGSERRLEIRAGATRNGRALICFEDSGPGIAHPQHLFQPFQQGSDVTGLGLFISRALVRSYGGELRFEPVPQGCCFAIELPLTAARKQHA